MNKEELMEKYGAEQVLCINNRYVEETDKLLTKASLYGHLRYRYNAELDYTEKQIIPYVVVRHGNKVLVTKRLQGDERLVGQCSVGTGGHIDSADIVMDRNLIDMGPTIENCIKRELAEETNLENYRSDSLHMIQVFVDESTDVSKVHACILFEYKITDEEFANFEIREKEKLEGNFIDLKNFDEKVIETLEGWSKIAYDILYNLEPKTTRTHKKTRKA